VVGIPGLLVALLMLTVREPYRRGKIKMAGAGNSDEISVGEVATFLKQRWKMFASHFIGMSVVTILGYAYFSWLPTMFIRTWGWTIGEISFAYGIIMLITVPIGANLGGWLSDWFYKKGHKDGHMRANLYGVILLMAIPYPLAPLMPTPTLALIVLVFGSVGGAWVTATGAASLMMICPNQMRGQISALYYFVLSLLGLTIGPSAVAVVTDFVFKDEMMLRYSLALTCGIAGVLGVVLLGYNLKLYRAAVIESEAWVGDGQPRAS
ncbi:MAG: MFS transporter, partial [Rhodospirillaceae bacterium]|nr:MFS transporter [Rhodospirillaceae bacterium]